MCEMGVMTTAVPQPAASSNVESSSMGTGRCSTFMPMSAATSRSVLLVMEGSTLSDSGVT